MSSKNKFLTLFLMFTTTLIMVIGLVHQPMMTWPVQAASAVFEISWWTIGSGGGSSSNPDYAISGTIGQPIAGPGTGGMSGGGSQVISGYWGSPSQTFVTEPPQPQEPDFKVFLPLVTH